MKQFDWSSLDNDDLLDEIEWTEKCIDFVLNGKLVSTDKQNTVNQYLEKLKSLYDEKRKRGII
jgi:hypothetical protein